MSFEDRLRDRFQRAEAGLPGERLDWNTTITRARRSSMRFTALAATAAVAAIALGGYAFVNIDRQSGRIGPAEGGPTEQGLGRDNSPSPSDQAARRKTCSASEIAIDRTAARQLDSVPDVVEQRWSDIIDAAMTCDYGKLEQLALAEGQGFTFSYGAPTESPSEYWIDREREYRKTRSDENAYMRYLALILQLPHCVEELPNGDVFYVWPRVHCSERTTSDWDMLVDIYPQKQIRQMRKADTYYGFRVGITESGDWQYFVAGD